MCYRIGICVWDNLTLINCGRNKGYGCILEGPELCGCCLFGKELTGCCLNGDNMCGCCLCGQGITGCCCFIYCTKPENWKCCSIEYS